jgi:molybdate transport system permease protein
VEAWGLGALGWTLGALLILPTVALVLTTTPAAFAAGLAHPLVWPALALSLGTTTVSLALVLGLGTPLAWWLAGRPQTRAGRLLESVLQLPMVIPPAVAGVALLLAFGRRGLLGATGGSVAFTTAAVVLAQVFVAAPLYLQSATAAFRRLDPTLLVMARSLGATPLRVLWQVAIPLAAPGLAAGAALCWARALGEFGATLMFAGNLEGVTQTLPLAIYTVLASDLAAAQALSLVLVGVALAVLLAARTFGHTSGEGAP